MKSEKSENGFIRKLATFIVDKKTLFFLLYGIALVFSVFSMKWVDVENDVTTYLPEDTETRQGLVAMNENFTTFATAKVMVSNITYQTAEEIRDMLLDVDGVQMVAFDDTEDHFRKASALYDVSFSGETNDKICQEAMNTIQENLADYDVSYDTAVGYERLQS